MALVLPYPNKPANGDTLDATVVQANFTAIAQAIQSFDGSQIQVASIQAAAMATAANPITRGLETQGNFVQTGAVVSTPSGLSISITGGVLYINGNRLTFAGVGSQTLLANKDYYIDVDNLGNVTYANVANGATAPALTANSIRIAMVVTGASLVGQILQTGNDNNGVKIYYTGAVGGAQAPGLWWEEIGRTTLIAAANQMTVFFPTRKYLRIVYLGVAASGTIGVSMRFNNDAGTNYAVRISIDGAADGTGTSLTSFDLHGAVGIAQVGELYINDNTTTLEKIVYFHGESTTGGGPANIPDRRIGAAKYANTVAPITRADLFSTAGTGNFAIGGEIVVMGHN